MEDKKSARAFSSQEKYVSKWSGNIIKYHPIRVLFFYQIDGQIVIKLKSFDNSHFSPIL
jgi:hypothetical protein